MQSKGKPRHEGGASSQTVGGAAFRPGGARHLRHRLAAGGNGSGSGPKGQIYRCDLHGAFHRLLTAQKDTPRLRPGLFLLQCLTQILLQREKTPTMQTPFVRPKRMRVAERQPRLPPWIETRLLDRHGGALALRHVASRQRLARLPLRGGCVWEAAVSGICAAGGTFRLRGGCV